MSSVRRAYRLLALCAAAVLSACGSDDPLAPSGETVVLMGRVSSLGAAGVSSAEGSSSLAGIEVSVEGVTTSTVTDASGTFRLEVEAGDSTIVLRFRRGALDARIEIDGVAPGSVITFEVSLDGQGGTVIRHDGDREDFEGRATFVSIDGDAPQRTLRVELSRDGASAEIAVIEGVTAFDGEGDVLTFAGLLDALDRTDLTVRIEGDGEILDDSTVIATFVKVETDEHDDGVVDGDDGGVDDDNSGPGDGDDDHHDDDGGGEVVEFVEFKGTAVLVSVSGTAPTRVARVRVEGDHDGLVDLVEGDTSFDDSGDFHSVGSVVTALGPMGAEIRLEGEGTVGEGGVIVATTARAEID